MPEPFDVIVNEVKAPERIVFEWPSASGYNTRVTMSFVAVDAQNTMVQVSESGWRADDEGIAQSYGNAGGWMHMISCLKAFLEYGINLRAGGVR